MHAADNAAFIAMAGPPLALDTLGGRTAFEIAIFAMVLAGLMNLFLVTRHLRAEEETIERYVRRREQANEAGEHGLAVRFDDIIADETNHRDEIRQILARWP